MEPTLIGGSMLELFGKIQGLIVAWRNRGSDDKIWICPKCRRRYTTPDENVPRIAMICPGWDFCPRCGTDRETGTVLYARKR